MRKVFNIDISGRINRRDLPLDLEPGEVQDRRNIYVIGNGKSKLNRKHPGANRWSDNDTGTKYVSGHRYYTGSNTRKTFAFNNGRIYHIDDNGNESQDTNVFSPIAIPSFSQMRVSSNDLLFMSEGISSGMYSHDGNIGNTWVKETAVTLNFVQLLPHLDRMFAFEDNSEDLYFSKNLEPTNYTDSTDAGVITIGPRNGSKIIGIALLNETLFIFKQDSIWYLSGRSPYEFEVREVHTQLGCVERRSIQNTERGIIFLASDFEFYSFGGSQESTVMLTYKLAISGDRTKNLLPLINMTKTDSICSTYFDKIYRCSFVANGETTNSLEYCFNTINETDFLTEGFNITCYIQWNRTPDLPTLFCGRESLGRLMKMYQGYNVDNGASTKAMRARLVTRATGADEPRNIRFRAAYFNLQSDLANGILKGFFYMDSRTSRSDAGSGEWTIRGEQKENMSVTMASQRSISPRVILPYGKSKGQNIYFEIDTQGEDLDFGLRNIDVEAIVTKPMKKSEKVSV